MKDWTDFNEYYEAQQECRGSYTPQTYYVITYTVEYADKYGNNEVPTGSGKWMDTKEVKCSDYDEALAWAEELAETYTDVKIERMARG